MQKIFSEFPVSSASDWKNQLIKDLKGEAYETLTWHNENGFDIRPFYTSEDLKQTYDPAFTHPDWEICVHGKANDAKELNKQLLQDLERGATSVSINVGSHDLNVVLQGIQLNYIKSVFFVNENNAGGLITYLQKKYKPEEINSSILPEELSSEDDLGNWSKTISLFETFQKIKTIGVNVLDFHNQNCFAYYEVAIILSALTEYLEFLSTNKKIPASEFVIKTGVSSDYFVQMAKLRAVRRLWAIFKEEYKITNGLYLIVETSLTNKSISDSYNNLVRTTTEAMTAVSGGCNELIVNEFDVLFATNKNLSGRLAINQQLILKDETYLDKMADLACGSFYVESITDAIASKALETFKRFEKEGGYFKCIEKNIFSKDIAAQSEQKDELLKTQKEIAIGVNKFKNEKEKINLPPSVIAELKKFPIGNPVLNLELENYFK